MAHVPDVHREYREFCHAVVGRFIDHVPDDAGAPTPNRRTPSESADATVRAIVAAGYEVDAELWNVGAKCNQCTDGCTHSSGDTMVPPPPDAH
jgi:hypothetical protein